MRRIIYLATVALVIGLYVLPTHSFLPVRQAHANPTIWFISYMDKDDGYVNLVYSYTFAWADIQASTITATSNWGDGTSDSTSSTGKCCDPPTAYSNSLTIGHIYTKTGVFLHSVTLSDPTGASVTKTTTITVTNADPSTPQVFTGGLGGKPAVPT